MPFSLPDTHPGTSIAPSTRSVEQALPPVLASRGRNALQQEMRQMCLTWPLDELFDTLVDYCYFNFVMVFDADAEERYRAENPEHPYFVGYQRVKEFNSTLLKHVATAFQIPDAIRAAMEEHSELIRVKRKSRGVLQCEVCGGRKTPTALVLRGRRYRLKGSCARYLKPAKNHSQEQHFVVCKFHYLLYKNYFHLRHMDWIVYWNCWQKIHVAREENCHSTSAEQLINQVDPDVVENLANFFLDFYKQLELWSHTNNGHPSNGCLMHSDWLRLVPLWKIIALVKRDVEKKEEELSTAGAESDFKALAFN